MPVPSYSVRPSGRSRPGFSIRRGGPSGDATGVPSTMSGMKSGGISSPEVKVTVCAPGMPIGANW